MILRSFIAIELPPEIQGAIAANMEGLHKALPKPIVRWVPTQNVHLTLKFLGDVSPSNLEQLAEALKMEAAQHTAFSISVGGLGAFPNPRRPRVIWIGIEAPAVLQTLQHGVETVSARLGYAAEERPFSPHLTLGRVGQNASAAEIQRIRSALETTKIGKLGTASVDTIRIFKSALQSTGPVYTHLYTLPLKP